MSIYVYMYIYNPILSVSVLTNSIFSKKSNAGRGALCSLGLRWAFFEPDKVFLGPDKVFLGPITFFWAR